MDQVFAGSLFWQCLCDMFDIIITKAHFARSSCLINWPKCLSYSQSVFFYSLTVLCGCQEFTAAHLWRNTDDSLQPKASRACIAAIALCHGDSWRLYFQLYYLNCPGKYVQWLYYQFMAPPATPLIQQLKHCNQWFRSCKRDINLSQDCLQPCRRDSEEGCYFS